MIYLALGRYATEKKGLFTDQIRGIKARITHLNHPHIQGCVSHSGLFVQREESEVLGGVDPREAEVWSHSTQMADSSA